MQVPVGKISANPWQPRGSFDHEKMEELAESMKAYGILQPLVVTAAGDGTYQLIAGERRLKAAEFIGLETVPVIVRSASEQQKLELSLVENIQRHNLNPIEEAVSYRRLMDEFNLTQEEVGQKVGKSRPSIANFLRLLSLPEEIQKALRGGAITFSHAKVILSYSDAKQQLKIFKKIIASDLTVEQAAQEKTISVRAHERQAGDPVLKTWEAKLVSQLGTRAKIKSSGSGGVIEISYSSQEDLKRILDQLLTIND